ncbi:hypothetical protein RSOLAG22IIIB_09981 [Rhizoctonia solani]|uniref:Ricin B lectin domain-containing protein n=1 Tax=Rhizoctonia solani TaxID=456999 RepID=A0A0K6G0C3_9AGAM|nr:hypothetical protein RSOLAG22IIIB_09981 [Rhizoctonia solani]
MGLLKGNYHIFCEAIEGKKLAVFIRSPDYLTEVVDCMPTNVEPPTLISVEPLGGNNYRLTPAGGTGFLVLGALPNDSSVPCKIIDPVDEKTHTVHPPPETGIGDQYWTAPESEMSLELHNLKGLPNQKWHFVPMPKD